jgi:hypothetical protein
MALILKSKANNIGCEELWHVQWGVVDKDRVGSQVNDDRGNEWDRIIMSMKLLSVRRHRDLHESLCGFNTDPLAFVTAFATRLLRLLLESNCLAESSDTGY